MISIGGYTDSNDGSNKYSNLVANSENIKTFVSSVMAFLDDNDLDGLDINRVLRIHQLRFIFILDYQINI